MMLLLDCWTTGAAAMRARCSVDCLELPIGCQLCREVKHFSAILLGTMNL